MSISFPSETTYLYKQLYKNTYKYTDTHSYYILGKVMFNISIHVSPYDMGSRPPKELAKALEVG